MSTEENKNISEEGLASTPPKVKKVKRSVADIVNSEVKRRAKVKAKNAAPEEVNLQWFIVQAYSGMEKRVRSSIEERFNKEGLLDYFGEVNIPEEEVTEVNKGEKHEVTRKFFPGYILVQMHLNDETKHLINNTPKVVGFVGDAKNPVPMSQVEVDKLMSQVEEGSSALTGSGTYEEGEMVRLVGGPFDGLIGKVDEVKTDKSKLTVLVDVFGRATPMEVDFYSVEKQ